MDIICSHCGEPWEMGYVLKQTKAFKRRRFLITRCPRCEENRRDPSPRKRKYFGVAAEIGFRFGGEIAIACWIADQYETALWGIFGDEKSPVEAKFGIGKIVCGRPALDALQDAKQLPFEFLSRHARGDWGDVSREDRKENDLAVTNGRRILSSYRTARKERIWVITDADRCMTSFYCRKEY